MDENMDFCFCIKMGVPQIVYSEDSEGKGAGGACT